MYCVPKCVTKREQRLVDLKIEQSVKTYVREDDLSRVSVRSTGGHSKRRSGFNQIGTLAAYWIYDSIIGLDKQKNSAYLSMFAYL